MYLNNLTNQTIVKLDKEAHDNIARFKENQEGLITTSDSFLKVYVMPTNEEIMIKRDTKRIIKENTKKLILK